MSKSNLRLFYSAVLVIIPSSVILFLRRYNEISDFMFTSGGTVMALDGMERMARDEFRGAKPRIFTTNPDHPDDGRIFVWTKMGWFEREEGPWGDVAFSPVADSEDQLRNWIAQTNPETDLVELDPDNEYGRMVLQEFNEQAEDALYPESPEVSSEEPFDEQDVD